ncbi:Ig-like domain-containing protein [Candidatus Parcubacteria bacterium]|nr:Ig-like domain-containing protein [Candidatus Parcubacteria bacterium]
MPIRNVVVRTSFNHNVDSATVNGNILILKKSDNSIVAGDFNTTGDKVEFVPSAACPAPNASLKCFEENTAYTINIKTGLKDTGGKNLVCGGFAPSCSAEFTTGALIDALPPQVSITYPDPGQSVSENALIDVWARATDDAGVSHIEFFRDGAYFDNDYPVASSPLEFNGSVFWDTTGVSRGTHNLSAKAYDIDSNNAFSDNLSVLVRAEHCFNGIQDADETGIDTGGVDCPVASGGACTQDSDCASNSCINGICVDTPIILNVSPIDGAPGTYVSIWGKYFGATAGTVTFLGAPGVGDDRVAQLAPCSGAWSSSMVIAVLPQGAVSGPIKIENLIGSDLTNDARGPVISDFLVNNIGRPGICQLNPNMGKSGTSFNIEGVNFGGSQGSSYIKFGSSFALPQTWGNTLVGALVPVLSAGDNSVVVNKGGIDSNAVIFKILDKTAGTKPNIGYIDPDKGPQQEYITIFGTNFGDNVGIIEFLRSDGTKAVGDVNFPAVCGKVDYWHDAYITVKVPATFSDGSSTKNTNVSIQVRRADNEVSNGVSFDVTSDTPRPGICGLNPDNGPIDATVEILGERFGASGNVTFYNNVSASADLWGSELVRTSVPQGAVSGPVNLTVNSVNSNSVNFTVGDCSQNPTLCNIDQQCCNSSCISKTAVCETGPKEGAYAWRISTGFIPKAPRVIEECSADVTAKTPSPSPWDARPGGNSVCVNATVNVRFDSLLEETTVVYSGLPQDTISLYKCVSQSDDPCEQVSKTALNLNYSGIYSVNNNEDGVQLFPQNGLEANSQYLVELTTGIRGAGIGGGFMEEKIECGSGRSYCFRFKTKNSTDPCKIGSLIISPGSYTSAEIEDLGYLATPRAKSDVCLTIDGSSYTYSWNSSKPANATILSQGKKLDGTPMPQAAIVGALSETPENDPAEIISKIVSENASGKGTLTVDFTDPQVVMSWPECTTACVNSTIGAIFNTSMNAATLNNTSITILKCKTENCTSFDLPNVSGNIAYDSLQKKVELTPFSNLEISRYYLVRLNTQIIKSTSGVSLIGANEGIYVSWKFKTRPDFTPCVINKINLSPAKRVFTYIPEKAEFNAEAIGAPDSCNPQGQRLNPYSFNWGWTSGNITIVSLLNNGAYNTLPSGSNTCSDKCLNLGSKPNVSVCGNSIKEIGEDCDDGGALDGDGCSSSCQNEGSSLNCGNSIKNTGEDCDDGNVVSGDGCSSTCLNEGSTAGKSICGNADTGTGEDCDYGDSVSGDGCSNQCLNEGTEAGIASCGNGKKEAGEDCDDGNVVNGDGCSFICLNEGTFAPTCGNGIINKGEDCDDSNLIFGDGCSASCLKEGSDFSYSFPSICGDNNLGLGEECEFQPTDNNIDPRQYVEAVGKGKTPISAKVNNVTGSADTEVLCIYTNDSQCPLGYGVGVDNCCYEKPRLINYVPSINQTGVCRNTLITFTFDKLMDTASGEISIDQLKDTDSCPEGSTLNAGWCEGAIQAVRSSLDDTNLKTTEFIFNISSILKPNLTYRVLVKNFKSKTGVRSIDGGWQFTTASYVCTMDVVDVSPNPLIFDKQVQVKQAVAKGISLVGGEQQISSVPGSYSWTWEWSNAPKKYITVTQNLTSPDIANVSSKQENGEEVLTAKADITDDLGLGGNTSVIGSARVIVFLCENPWGVEFPSGRLSPFSDPNFNFSTYYCRDDKTLLPYLNTVSITPVDPEILREYLFTNPDTGDAIGVRVYPNSLHYSALKWYQSKNFAGNPASTKVDGYNGIIDGRSTYINAANHTASNFTNIFVISYNQNASLAMQNIYKQFINNWVFNTNLLEANSRICELSGTSCVSNLDCGNSDFCFAEKDKLTRDVLRIENFNDIADLLENYKQQNNIYPQLLSGSFLRGFSVSTWPSWQAALGNDLGKALPSDPLNKHKNCEISRLCSVSNKTCHMDEDCSTGESCLPETTLCWNGEIGEYQCTFGSHVYQYKNISQDNYQIASDFEFMNGNAWWAPSGVLDPIEPTIDPNQATDNFKVSGSCIYETIGTSLTCGDGIVGQNEECEKGQENYEPCTAGGKTGFRKLTCNPAGSPDGCFWNHSAICQTGQCGDGVVQSPEYCDDGQKNGAYGYCNTSCSELAGYCGDGTKNGSEQCDLGAKKNGSYNSGCSWDCKLPGPMCGDGIVDIGQEKCDGNVETSTMGCTINQDGYPTQKIRTCDEKLCTWNSWSACLPAGVCGNGIKEGTEICDDGDGLNTNTCTNDCKLAICGDGYIRSGYEFCDNGITNGIVCKPGYGLTCNYCGYTCNIVTATGDFCGDGIQNGNEECDGGDFGGLDCGSFGLIGDGLTCSSNCTVDTNACSYLGTPI